MKSWDCLLDMDGVLVDFVFGVTKLHGLQNPYNNPESKGIWDTYKAFQITHLTEEQYYAPMRTFDFWAGLSWMSDAHEILELVELFFGKTNVCIMTAPLCPECTYAKHWWIETNMPDYKDQFMIGKAKHFGVSPNTVLIDDKDENVNQFIAKGGNAILLPRPWNSAHAKPTMKTLQTALTLLGDEPDGDNP